MTKRPFREEGDQMDSIGMAKVLMLLSQGAGGAGDEAELHVDMQQQQQHPGRVFECKTCNRQFPSFQALGGHRASHKKPRLMAGDQNGQAPAVAALTKPRVHECSICGVEFAIGQALGGHMRRHRSATEGFPLVQLLEKKTGAVAGRNGEKRPSGVLCLDLDLNQPPADHDKDVRCALNFSLGPPMVCLH
ncbi:hypothetical protein Taro_043831 [Colocasia esculenta]|uniref:C2H2-type domain-containing protein n=1 Tax=Colocasia esculenta TaxID=4460 RepID=A0A843WHG4_COLES|nr:hypothetical protein [Colocasia esculenta]